MRQRILEGPAGAALQALDTALEASRADDPRQARTPHALWWVAADLATGRPGLRVVPQAAVALGARAASSPCTAPASAPVVVDVSSLTRMRT